MSRRRAELWRRDPRPGALAIAFGLMAVGFAVFAAVVILYHPWVAFDERLSAAFRSIATPGLDTFFRVVTQFGGFWFITAATLLLAGVLFMRDRPAQAVLVLAAVGAGAALGHVLRESIERARPGLEIARIPVPDAYSFPSGHALASFLFFGILFFVVALEAGSVATRFRVLAACVATAALVAFSRVYLGVHWFGDVVASWVLGAAWLTLCAAVYFAVTSGDRPT